MGTGIPDSSFSTSLKRNEHIFKTKQKINNCRRLFEAYYTVHILLAGRIPRKLELCSSLGNAFFKLFLCLGLQMTTMMCTVVPQNIHSPPQKEFCFGPPPILPPRNSSLASYKFASIILALETPFPLGISDDLPWHGYGFFLELHNKHFRNE